MLACILSCLIHERTVLAQGPEKCIVAAACQKWFCSHWVV